MNIKQLAIILLILIFAVSSAGCSSADLRPGGKPVVLYVPLDGRPLNYGNVVSLARCAGVELLAPSREMLGEGGRPADTEALFSWVQENMHRADACVVSADALLYGGLVASRTHQRDREELLAKIDQLGELHGRHEMPVYVFATVMRSAASSASGKQPGYFEEHGDKFLHLSRLAHRARLGEATPEQLAEMKRIKESIPGNVLEDYMQRRETNLAALQEMLGLARDGVIDYLVLGRDDCEEYSFSSMELAELERKIEEYGIESSTASLPGTDELGAVLLARAVNKLRAQAPGVYVHWGTPRGPGIRPGYEDIPLGENARQHITAAGAERVDTPGQADLVLAVNTPREEVKEAAYQEQNEPAPRHNRLAERVSGWIDSGTPAAVADVAYNNGADRALMRALARKGVTGGLAGYAGCNTAGNSLGTALAQGLACTDGNPGGDTAAPRRNFLAARLVNDWGYQAVVRPAVVQEYPEIKNAGTVLDRELLPAVENDIQTGLNRFAASELQGFPGGEIKVDTVTLPWNRLFEVRFQVNTGDQ